MTRTNDISKIIGSEPEQIARWLRVCREGAAQDRLTPLPGCDALVLESLSQGVENFLGAGSFSHVYAIDEHRAMKFTRDLTSLQVMQKLCSRSDYFARLDQIFENQASDQDGLIFHAAIVERLQIGYPVWIRSVVEGYRRPFKAESPTFAYGRLLQVSSSIKAGNILIPPNDVEPFSEAMRILGEECLAWRCIADLGVEDNVMMRANGQVVIADPAHPYDLIGR